MGDRVIRLGDLAGALSRAGAAPVRDGATVTSLHLEIAMLVRDLPEGDALWSTWVRQRPRPRFAWLLARWRRARRRRAGWAPRLLQLRWAPHRIDALVDGRRIAHLSIHSQGTDR